MYTMDQMSILASVYNIKEIYWNICISNVCKICWLYYFSMVSENFCEKKKASLDSALRPDIQRECYSEQICVNQQVTWDSVPKFSIELLQILLICSWATLILNFKSVDGSISCFFMYMVLTTPVVCRIFLCKCLLCKHS